MDLSGQVDDKNLASYFFRYGEGDLPISWKELASGTSSFAGSVASVKVGKEDGVKDGILTFLVSATDKAGLSAEHRLKVTVDNTPPSVEISTPAENIYLRGPFAIKGTVTDATLDRAILEIAKGSCSTASTWAPLKIFVSPVQGLLYNMQALPPDGDYCVRMTATDKLGNTASAKINLKIDAHPPTEPVLGASVENRTNVKLTWPSSPETDVAGYNVYRDGVKINASLSPLPLFLDSSLHDGKYVFTATAIDLAGNESTASNAVSVQIDSTPPTVRISIPQEQGKVAGISEIVGTAYSSEDFKEYRIFIGEGVAPQSWSLIRKSPDSVMYGSLGRIDTFLMEEGIYSLRVEGEDYLGNIGEHKITFSVDNSPPAPPALISAVLSGSDVTITWGANSETDLAGYVVFRNERPANAVGMTVQSLRSYVVRGTSYTDKSVQDGTYKYYLVAMDQAWNFSSTSNIATVTIDFRAPKATIKEPASSSKFDNNLKIAADSQDNDIAGIQLQYQKTGEPSWHDVGAAVSIAPYIVYFNPLSFGLTYGTFNLRAVATDTGGKTDTSPSSISVIYADLTPPAVPTGLEGTVTGNEVKLEWGQSTEPDFAGYIVYRVTGSTRTKITSAPIAAPSYTDTGLPDGLVLYEVTAVDSVGNESAPVQAFFPIYAPQLSQPFTPAEKEVTVTGEGAAIESDVEIKIVSTAGLVSIFHVGSDSNGKFTLRVPLYLGENRISARVVEKNGDTSRFSNEVLIVSNERPSPPTGLSVSVSGYVPTISWDPSTEDDVIGYNVYRDGKRVNGPQSAAVSSAISSARSIYSYPQNAVDGNVNSYWSSDYGNGIFTTCWFEVSLTSAESLSAVIVNWWWENQSGQEVIYGGKDFDVQAWTGAAWVTVGTIIDNSQKTTTIAIPAPYRTGKIRLAINSTLDTTSNRQVRIAEIALARENPLASTSFTEPAPLADGKYTYSVTAVDYHGSESEQSEAALAEVGDVVPPGPPANIRAIPGGSSVVLAWAPPLGGEVATYSVYQRIGSGWSRINSQLITATGYTHENLRNGSYTYRVTAVDGVGNESEPSGETSADVLVLVPQKPEGVAVSSVAEGAALDISWNAGNSALFNIYRSFTGDGVFTKVNGTLLTTPSFRDTGLINGQIYFYVVKATDAAGNESITSDLVSGVPADTLPPMIPQISIPTIAGYEGVASGVADIAGTADGVSTVEIFRNGESIGTAVIKEGGGNFPLPLGTQASNGILSPDGTAVVYPWGNSLILRSYGAEPITIATTGKMPVAWSPDGKRVAFTYLDSNVYRVAIYDRETRTISPVTDWINTSEWTPSWGGGGILTFTANRGGSWGLWMKNLSSGELSQVVAGSVGRQKISPDGTKIAYFKYPSLFMKDLVSGTTTQIENNPQSADNFSWSPDSTRIAFNSSRSGSRQLHIYDVENGVQSQVTRSLYDKKLPTWSPSGDAIAYFNSGEYVGYGSWYSIKISTLDGTETAVRANLNYSYPSSLVWPRDGEIAYVDSSKPYRLFTGRFFLAEKVRLDSGINSFEARGADLAGNWSERSEAIHVVNETSTLPDLSVSEEDVIIYPLAPKPGGDVAITAKIRNQSAVNATNVPVLIYHFDPSGTLSLVADRVIPLLSGNSWIPISTEFNVGTVEGSHSFFIQVDAGEIVAEKTKSNNFLAMDFNVFETPRTQIAVSPDNLTYDVDDDVAIEVTIDSLATSGASRFQLLVEDGDFNLVAAVADDLIDLVLGERRVLNLRWNTGSIFAGSYRVRALLAGTDGIVTESTASFAILPDVLIESGVVTDKKGYGANENVAVTFSLKNAGSNYLIPQMKVKGRIVDSANATIFIDEKEVRNLFPATGVNLPIQWNTGLNPPGDYRVVLDVYIDDMLVSNGLAPFAVNPDWTVNGTVAVEPAAVIIGNNLKAGFTVANKGNIDAVGIIKALIIDSASQVIVAAAEQTVSLPMNSSLPGIFTFPSQGLDLKPYLVSLLYVSSGGQKNIASASFTVKDGTPPIVNISSPSVGTVYNSTVSIAVLASDNASGVEKVEYQVDDGTWKLLPLADPVNGRHATTWEPTLADYGIHTINFRATDRAGNISNPVSNTFEIQMDNVPPVTIIAVGSPKFETGEKLYVASVAQFILTASDNFSGVVKTEYRIDDAAFASYGVPFNLAAFPDGGHTIAYRSVDNVTNLETVKQIDVVLDKTPPTTVITASDPLAEGVVNTVSPKTAFSLTASDKLAGVKGIWYRIDGGQWQLYSEGFRLTGLKAGSYTISFTACDNVGNDEVERSVTVRLIQMEVKKEISLEPVVLVGAWTDNLNRVKKQGDIDTLAAILTANDFKYHIAEDGDDFKRSLRSGRYTTYILVDYKDEKMGGELREAVNYGDSLIFIKTRPGADPVLDEVLGVKFTGKTTGDNLTVNLAESPLSPAATIQSSGKSVVGAVTADTASVFGYVSDKKSQNPAVVFNGYGGGKVLLFTFDILNSADKEKVAGLMGNSITLLKPGRHGVRALASVPVRIAVASSTEPLGLRVTETIPAGTTADTIIPQGTATQTAITWQQYLEGAARAEFGCYLNLPDAKGEYTATTDVRYANFGAYHAYETAQLTASVLNDSADLLRAVITELNCIPSAGSNDLVILTDTLSMLSQVTTDPLDGKDAEKSIEAVTRVSNLIRGLSADTADIRLKLDELLKILERKWYLLNLREQTG